MAEVLDQKTSLLDSAVGPVAVTTTKFKNFDIDDYVSLSVKSKAEYLRLLNKATQVDPLEARNRPPVTVGGNTLGGYDAV